MNGEAMHESKAYGKRDEAGTGRRKRIDGDFARAVEHDREQRPVRKRPVRRQPGRHHKIDQRRQHQRHRKQYAAPAGGVIRRPGDVGKRGAARPQRREKEQRTRGISRSTPSR